LKITISRKEILEIKAHKAKIIPPLKAINKVKYYNNSQD